MRLGPRLTQPRLRLVRCFWSSLLAVFAAAPLAGAQDLTGAGGSFPNPIYVRWFAEYHQAHPETRINYQPVGSGAGIRQLLAGVIDFGATERPLTDEELAHAPAKLLHIPTLLGAVVPVYNLAQTAANEASLRFAPDVLADIYLGRITRWNDLRLLRDNPGATLPDLAIVPVYRADGAGTTYIFTEYLSKVSPAFAKSIGRGVAVRWPAGIGGKGSEGVTGLVRSTPGALGYAEAAYARESSLRAGLVRNAAGIWVQATPASVEAAAQPALTQGARQFRVSLTNAAGTGAYPITSFTWLLLRTRDLATAKGRGLAGFLGWMLDRGEDETAAEGYAPLPQPVADQVRTLLQTP